MTKLSALSAIMGTVLLCAVPVSLHGSKSISLSLDTAEARIGRPLTPLSIAGVNRRAYRRAYYGGAYTPYYGYPTYGYAPYRYAPYYFADPQRAW